MDNKTKKIYQSIFDVGNGKNLPDAIGQCALADFDSGLLLWEFCYLTLPRLAFKHVSAIIDQMIIANKVKMHKAFCDNAFVKKYVISESDVSTNQNYIDHVASLVVGQKVEEFAEQVKLLHRNTTLSIGYGKTIQYITESAFDTITAKNGKVMLTKKQSEMLKNAIKGINTVEKALLEQRIREVM